MSEYDVRDMTHRDVDHITNFFSKTPGIDFLPWEDNFLLKRCIDRNPSISKVAVDVRTKELIGAIFGGHDGLRGCLHHLYVLPDWRRRGIADQLIKQSIQSFKESGCGIRRMFGLVYGNNHSSINLLRNNNFTLSPHLNLSLPCVVSMWLDLD